MRNRNEIPEEFKWNFADMFATPEDWEKAYAECEALVPSLAALKGTLGESAESLTKAYDTIYAFEEKLELVADYAFLGTAIDEGPNALRGKEVEISTEDSALKLLVIPTDEELMIAQDTFELTQG